MSAHKIAASATGSGSARSKRRGKSPKAASTSSAKPSSSSPTTLRSPTSLASPGARRAKVPLRRVEDALGECAEKWEGRCFEIASRMVAAGLVKGVAVYGHWTGEVHRDSPFFAGSGAGFVQHGWVVVDKPSGVICDPTRWVFEHKEPYIYWGPNNGEYDEGGNKFRMSQLGPPPDYNPDERHFQITKELLPSKPWGWVEKYLRIDICEQPTGELTSSQLWYLAHTSPEKLGEHAGPIFDALVKLGHEALIPIDNKRLVDRQRGK